MGFQLDNLFKGENPLTKPEPIFRSPRNIVRMLTQNVNRTWYQPAAVVGARAISGACTNGGGGGTPPWFIITFRDGDFNGGNIVSQPHGTTASDLNVSPRNGDCRTYGGDGYDITIAGDRPPGPVTVNVLFSGAVSGDPPGGCRAVTDGVRGIAYPIIIPAGVSTVHAPPIRLVSRRPLCIGSSHATAIILLVALRARLVSRMRRA